MNYKKILSNFMILHNNEYIMFNEEKGYICIYAFNKSLILIIRMRCIECIIHSYKHSSTLRIYREIDLKKILKKFHEI